MRHLKPIRVMALPTVLLVVLTIVATISATLAHASSLTLATVSGPSPYKNCSTTGQQGTNYLNAEVEPWVSVNPANPLNIIGAWQQDRWSNGGAQGLVAGFTLNGGKSWSESTLPFSGCAPGAIVDPFTGTPYDRASDPWVSIGPDGTAYTVGLLATESTISGNNDTGVATATSSNGGSTWGNPFLIKSDQGTSPIFEVTQFFNDKESITADPVKRGTAYVVWDRLVAPSHSPDADLRAHAFRGPSWFSKTTDGGKTWTGTRAIFDPGQNSQTIGNQIVVDPRTGVLYDFFELFQTTGSPDFTPRGASADFISSSDGGNTWSQPTVIATQQTANDTDPNTGANIRTGGGLPEVAIDARSGQLYVVWEDARFTGGTVNQAVISTSTNGGKSWSAPAAVSAASGKPAFTPSVSVNSVGTVAVTYYDFRNLAAGNTTTLPTDYWLTSSTNHGASFGNETHIAGSFDMMNAPNAGGLFVGDYEGLTAVGTTFEPFFVQTNDENTSNRTDVYTTFV
ncbi:MAG TPA: sialidase family protein [Ktedonobacteraceae bacterium]